MTDSDGALQRLYDDPGWREDLNDAEAAALLKWAESQLAGRATQIEAQAAAQTPPITVEQIHNLLKRINRLVGKRDQLTPADQQALLDEIAAAMHVTTITPDALKTSVESEFSAQAVSDDFLPVIGALTTWMDGGELPSAPAADSRADTGLGAPQVQTGIAQSAQPAEPPAPPPPDPNLTAIFGFFNTAPDSDTPPSPEDSNADTP